MLKQYLITRGANVGSLFYCLGSGYFLPYNRMGVMSSYSHPSIEDFHRAKKFGLDMVLGTSETNWPEISKKPPFVYRIE